ncbi:hypothetical protein [Pleurocapsa sp. PCC 7319]|uniref:hypothetical protein n=1 Tax=Pleurocapsa sp. PCC 7319 TaxID=118161 RepID=UPI00034AB558|nr:hypothetical protein [Pleurocapsa sp. PCC 7319]
MIDEVNIIVTWESKKDDELNQYRLRIYLLSWIKAIVVASDITHFPHRKIADITPQIIRMVGDYFDLCPRNIMLVEHYPSDNSQDKDIYLHILLKGDEIMRYEIEKDKLTRLIYYLI